MFFKNLQKICGGQSNAKRNGMHDLPRLPGSQNGAPQARRSDQKIAERGKPQNG